MSDINFDCPHCGQNLDAPEDMPGMVINCPACEKPIKVPTPAGLEVPFTPAVISTQAAAAKKMAQTGVIPPVNEDKGNTVRIELPPEAVMPERKHRVIFIKRTDK